MKLIFLDIDGVLITKHSKTSWIPHPPCVYALQKILDNTGASIVVSSSWRHIHGIDLQRTLSQFGLINFKYLGITPDLKGDNPRGYEIIEWFNSMSINHNDTKFVIIDDDDDMGKLIPFLVRTNWDDGLSFDMADRAIRMLRD